MCERLVGWTQIVGGLLIVFLDRAVFVMPTREAVALVVAGALFVVLGAHQVAVSAKKR